MVDILESKDGIKVGCDDPEEIVCCHFAAVFHVTVRDNAPVVWLFPET